MKKIRLGFIGTGGMGSGNWFSGTRNPSGVSQAHARKPRLTAGEDEEDRTAKRTSQPPAIVLQHDEGAPAAQE